MHDGTGKELNILERITKGEGRPEDIDTLEALSRIIKGSSLCGLGQTAPNPVLYTLRHFRHEYEAHINEKICPAHACVELVAFEVDVEGICVKCMSCIDACRFDAIS